MIGAGTVIGGNVWLAESVPPYSKVSIGAPNLERRQGVVPSLGDGI